MTIKECNDLILSKYKDSEIVAIYSFGTNFLYAIKPKKTTKEMIDNFFIVDKTTGAIKEYSPVLNTIEFKKFLSNRIK